MSADHLNAEVIGALIDGELAPLAASVARQHLADCHTCALETLTAMQLKTATSRAAKHFTPSETTFTRLKRSTLPLTKRSTPIITFPSLLWAGAAALLVFAVSFVGMRQLHTSDGPAVELLDQHLAALSNSSTPQVISSDRHTVKPWFQGKLPFSFNLPEPNALPQETTLQGADLTYFKGKAAAMLLFTIRKHRVTVFVVQGTELQSHRHESRAGFNLSEDTAPGLQFAAVSDTTAPDLDALVSCLVAAQQR